MRSSAILRAERQIERMYCRKKRNALYIACEEYDFTWSDTELTDFRQMWKDGVPIDRIAVTLQRHVNEVAILVIDQAERGYIRRRRGAAYGWKEDEDEHEA